MKTNPQTSNIWLIRHSESSANAGYSTDSSKNVPLTEAGTEQAYIFAKKIKSQPDLIVTSA
ncbi:MAG: hypothetical protein DSY50_04825, partial [Desulfobulbus sp.]